MTSHDALLTELEKTSALVDQRMAEHAEMLATLKDCLEVLDRYSDVDNGQGNAAMRMLVQVQEVIKKIEGAS